jgi:hypothetical protein
MLAPASIVLMIGFFILVHPPRITKAFCRNRLQLLTHLPLAFLTLTPDSVIRGNSAPGSRVTACSQRDIAHALPETQHPKALPVICLSLLQGSHSGACRLQTCSKYENEIMIIA